MKTQEKVKILIVDDERTLCETMSEILKDEGYDVEVAFDGKEALEKIQKTTFDVIFCDLRMPKTDGLGVLEKTMEKSSETFFIVMTAYGSMETTLKALKLGAYDYVIKPLVFEDVLLKLEHLVAFKKLSVENRDLKGEVIEQFALDNVLGQGTEMRAVYSLIQRVAPTPTTILITGEIGVGKEKLAKAIHYQSKQDGRSFMVVRCGSYEEAQLDRTLFGKEGIFYRSEEGTLFLDDISELSLALQLKLIQFLNGEDFKKCPTRLIIATTKDLSKEAEKGKFREDLLYRINVIEIKVPPLRARKNDVPFLVKFFVRTLSEGHGKRVRYVTDQARDILVNYSWRGNIRELENVLERAILLCDPDTQYIDVHDLPTDLASMALHSMKHSFKEAMRQYEYKHIQEVLQKNQFDKKRAAEELGLSLSSLYRKIEELSLPIQ